MITDLETLLNANQLQELVKAIVENKDFSFDQNGLTIQSKSTDDSLAITISYDSTKNEKEIVKQEREAFLEFIKGIDDNIFIEVCEILGQDLVNKIQELINGDDLEAARGAILRFKNEYRNLLVNRINYLNKCLARLDK